MADQEATTRASAESLAAREQSGQCTPIYRIAETSGRFRQGEIVSNLVEWVLSFKEDGTPALDPVVHSYAVILSQDCDLEQDWRAEQSPPIPEKPVVRLRSLLWCPAWEWDKCKGGRLKSLGSEDRIKKNQESRFAYLASIPSTTDRSGQVCPALLLDFREVSSTTRELMYRQLRTGSGLIRRARLDTPWAEHLSVRYASYLSRIGLPVDHHTAC